MAKRRGVISGKNIIKHPRKTKKRLEAKRVKLAALRSRRLR